MRGIQNVVSMKSGFKVKCVLNDAKSLSNASNSWIYTR